MLEHHPDRRDLGGVDLDLWPLVAFALRGELPWPTSAVYITAQVSLLTIFGCVAR
jgi:hypothetical protein